MKAVMQVLQRAVACALVLGLVGCASSSTPATNALTGGPAVAANPLTGSGVVSGNVNVQATSKTETQVYVALMQGQSVVRRTTTTSGGTFSFAGLADGSYQVVLSGEGLRTQSDVFNVRNGAVIQASYTLSQTGAAPSAGEAQGLVTQALRFVRGLSGYRALPLAAQGTIDFNRRYNFVTPPPGKTKTADANPPTVLAIPVPGALSIAVDPTGMAWVSVNNALFSPPNTVATSAGVVQINTDAQVVGQFATAAAANSGGGVVCVSDSLDVAVQNLTLGSLCLLPRGTTDITSFPPVSNDVSVTAMASQPIPGASSRSRIALVGQTNNLPTLGFLLGSATLAPATLPAGIPTTFVPMGVYADPADQTLYVSGYESGGLNGPAHLYHLSAEGTTQLEDVNLGAFRLTFAQNLTRDSAGNFWMGSNANLVKVGPAPTRTVSVIPATHFDSSSFGRVSSLAADAAGHVWATDQDNNNVTELDTSGVPLMTLNTAAQPTSLAVDTVGNIWISCLGASQAQGTVNKVVIGGNVPPNTQVQTYVAPSGNMLTVQPAPTGSTLTQTFANASYASVVRNEPSVIDQNAVITSRTEAVLVSGPTLVSQTAQVQSDAYSVSGTSIDARSGSTTQFNGTFQSNGTGSFIAFTPEGRVDVTYQQAPGGGGRIGMQTVTTQYSDVAGGPQIVHYQITATFESNGSVSAFQVTSNASDLAIRGQMAVNGSFLAQIFDISAPQTQFVDATTTPNTSIVNALLQMLAQSVPVATPTSASIASMFQTMGSPFVPYYSPGPTPGYTSLTLTYADTGATEQVDVPIATTTVSQGSTDVQAAVPPTQTVGAPDAGGHNVPANQGVSVPFDYSGQAGLEIAGICTGGTGFDKGGPYRRGRTR